MRKKQRNRRHAARVKASAPRMARVVCDVCGHVQTNRRTERDEPTGCRRCGHLYGTYHTPPV